jgi:hypothetical protein
MGQNIVAINVGCGCRFGKGGPEDVLKEPSVQVASISSLKDDTSRDISENSDSATQYDIPFSRRVPVKSRKRAAEDSRICSQL